MIPLRAKRERAEVAYGVGMLCAGSWESGVLLFSVTFLDEAVYTHNPPLEHVIYSYEDVFQSNKQRATSPKTQSPQAHAMSRESH